MKSMPVTRAFFTILLVAGTASSATITIINKDAAGVGFNDLTPAVPVGGNFGITLGQQRLNAFSAAASIWGAKLSSPIEIKIAANFGPLTPCDVSSGVLGSAGPSSFHANFPSFPKATTWYPTALASALEGVDQAATNPDGRSISASFNSNIGTPQCLPSLSWYLGLDGNHGTQIDLVTVLLHEFGHGLGVIGLVDLSSGAYLFGIVDVFSHFTRDNSTAMNWNTMSNAQRLTSITNTDNVVFDGPSTTSSAATVLSAGKDGSNHPQLYTPNPDEPGSSVYHFNTAASPNQLMEPRITPDLTHNVDIPNDLTASVMFDIGWTPPSLSGLNPPANVVATATSGTSVNVTWTLASGATSYRVYRNIGSVGAYILVGTPSSPPFTDNTGLIANTAYVYRVRSHNGSVESGDSNVDLATTVIFTDSTLTPASTPVKAVHFTQMRTAVNAVQILASQVNTPYTDVTLDATVNVKGVHTTELRTRLIAARVAITGLTPATFTNTISSGTTVISAFDMNQLRAWVQ